MAQPANSSYQKTVRGPYLPNIEAITAMGINPATGLPFKMGAQKSFLKQNIMKQLRLDDQACFVNRFHWYNLPRGLDSQDLERMLYYKGQICVFWNKTLNKFFATPFGLEGPIDYMGRPTLVHPVPFVEGNTQDGKGNVKDIADWFATLKLRVLWDIPTIEELAQDPAMMENCCVIIQDYTPQISQTVLPRQAINEGIIDLESDLMPFLRTALLNATGVRGVRVNNEDEAFQVFEASKSMNDASLSGQKYIPMIGDGLDFQDFTDGTVAKAEEFLLAMQAIDNFRMGALGLDNGGIFQKKAHELQAEASMAGSNASLILNDCLIQRQKKAEIMVALWGQPISVDIAEGILGADLNGDGLAYQADDTQSVPANEGGEM